MQVFPALNEYRGDDEQTNIAVNITVSVTEDVDLHDAIHALIDTARDLVEKIHALTECAGTDPADRSAALAALFLDTPDDENGQTR